MGFTSERALEYGKKAAGFVAGVFAIVVAFQQKIAEVSLESRFFLVGLAGALAVLFSTSTLCGKRDRFETKKLYFISWLICPLAIIAICGLTILLLRETASFHNILILRRDNPGDSNVATIEVQPPHSPVNLILRLSTPQSGPIILDQIPGSLNKEDVAEWRMENGSPYGVTLILLRFRSPQVFGVWYRLSGAAGALRVQTSVDPAQVRILRDRQLAVFYQYFWIFGGSLCVAGLLYWLYLLFW